MSQSSGSSQYSQSILAPEAPTSPNILESPEWLGHSITFTEFNEASNPEASNDSVITAYDAGNDLGIVNVNEVSNPEVSNDSAVTAYEVIDANDNVSNLDEASNDRELAVNEASRHDEATNAIPNVNEVSNDIHNEQSNDSTSTVVYEPEAITDWLNLEPGETRHSEDSLPSLPEVQTRKRSDTDEGPPAKVRKISSPKSDDETAGETCPICLDSWGNSGNHRLVALKCGHLFGSECVERWLKAQKLKERSCPTCKSKANIKDLRFIYARRLVAADTTQLTELQKQIETLQSEKSRTELELQKTKIAHRACVLQLDVLRSTLMKSQVTKEQTVRRSWRFALEKNLEISKDRGCRVMTYNCRTYELYVSQKSTNYLFPGYGIRKVSCVDYKLGQFVHLHTKPIRDITYSQPRDLLLSVGLDSTARIVERGIPSVTVNAGMPLWSCSWDYLRSNEFYVGGVGGIIHQYDVRNPSTYLQLLSSPEDISPVVSLCSTEFGLLSCHLTSGKLWVANMRQWESRALPISGSFMSLCYDNESHRAVVYSRPSAGGSERSKLTICKLKASVPNGDVLCNLEETIFGSTRSSLMSRAAWVRAPGASWVAFHSESDSTLYLHGVDGSRTMILPASEPALDVTSVELNGNTLVAALSESRLRLYKAVPTNS